REDAPGAPQPTIGAVSCALAGVPWGGPPCRLETRMTRRAPAPDYRRLLGRSLLTLANVITVAAPIAADWNDSHIFNDHWPAHARFHGVTALAMATSLSTANVWSVW